jgi:hypothetical protein
LVNGLVIGAQRVPKFYQDLPENRGIASRRLLVNVVAERKHVGAPGKEALFVEQRRI